MWVKPRMRQGSDCLISISEKRQQVQKPGVGELAGVFKGTGRREQALGLKAKITGAGRNGVKKKKKKGFVKHRRNNSMLVY